MTSEFVRVRSGYGLISRDGRMRMFNGSITDKPLPGVPWEPPRTEPIGEGQALDLAYRYAEASGVPRRRLALSHVDPRERAEDTNYVLEGSLLVDGVPIRGGASQVQVMVG